MRVNICYQIIVTVALDNSSHNLGIAKAAHRQQSPDEIINELETHFDAQINTPISAMDVSVSFTRNAFLPIMADVA